MSLIIIIFLFAIAWVVLILPKQRELKRHNALLATLAIGDDVMTGAGIYGTIVEIEGDIAIVQVAPGVELKVARRAIAAKVAPTAGEPAVSDASDTVESASASTDDDDDATETER